MSANPSFERVRSRLGATAVQDLDANLPLSDLSSLLMSVAQHRAALVTPAQLVSDPSRFIRPARVDARALARLEADLWEGLPVAFHGVEVSPVTSLGTCSALAPVDQNQVVTTVRGTEVVSDATNVLAVEAARRRRGGALEVHLAAGHRVLRAQHFDHPEAAAHFRLLNLVSTARDQGSGHTEARLLSTHLTAWSRLLTPLLPGAVVVRHTVFKAGAPAERLLEHVLPALAGLGVLVEDLPDRPAGGYYGDVAFKVMARTSTGDVELGDGGLVGWTAALLSDAKERCVISCLATERLLALIQPAAAPARPPELAH